LNRLRLLWSVALQFRGGDRAIPLHPRHICQTDFNVLFKSRTIASRRSNLGEGVNVREPLTHDSEACISPLE